MKIENNGLYTNYVFKSIPLAFDESMSYYETLCALMQAVKDNRTMIEQIAIYNEITYANPLEWNITSQYPRYQIVMDSLGNAYLSSQPVPSGIELTNKDYWVKVFNYDVQLKGIEDKIEQNKDYINVLSLGVDNTGVNDVSTLIQQAIENNPLKTLFFPSGTYLWNNKVDIGTANNSAVSLKFDTQAYITSSLPIDYFIGIGSKNTGGYNQYAIGNNVTISGGKFISNNVDKAIYIVATRKDTQLLNVTIQQLKNYGVYIDNDIFGLNNHSADCIIDNLVIKGNRGECTGIYVKGSDNYFNNIMVIGCKIGMELLGGGNKLENVHITASKQDNLNDTIGIINSSNNIYTNLYLDTCEIGIKNTRGLTICNLFTYYYKTHTKPFIVIDTSSELGVVHINGGLLEFNETENVVLNCKSGIFINGRKNSLTINGVSCKNRKVPDGYIDFYDNVEVNNGILKEIYTNDSTTMLSNQWYLIGYVHTYSYCKFGLENGPDFYADVTIKSKSSKVYEINVTNVDKIWPNAYEIGVGEETKVINGVTYQPLYLLKMTNGSFKPYVTNTYYSYENIGLIKDTTKGGAVTTQPTVNIMATI